MLARLLRRLLLGQILFGALLGWALAALTGCSLWLAALLALLFPLALIKLGVLYTALKSRTPNAGLLWWHALVGEVWATLRVVLLQLPWAKAAPAIEWPVPGAHGAAPRPRLPVLLVHGFVCNHRIWDPLAKRLGQAGHAVLRVDLEPLFTSIDNYAPLIERAVMQLCEQTGHAKVALVGHSMGGLVIRAWLRACGSARVAQVITLGTPHAGTQIAQPSHTANGRQMVWHSAWLQALAASESAATRSLMRIALTPQDNIVHPQREQGLPGVAVTEVEGLGHIQLCLDDVVLTWVLQQLDDVAHAGKP